MYPDDNSKSRALYERARAVLPGGNTRTTVHMSPYPVYLERGAGCRVWDVDGVARIDVINNFTAAIHGHAHPVLTQAAQAQAALGTAFGMPTAAEIELAEGLAARIATVDQCRFTNSGTEAVMAALKAARAFTGRAKIAKCEGAYHGSYDYAEVSLDTPPSAWRANAPVSTAYAAGTPPAVLEDVVVVPFNDVDGAAEVLRAHAGELAAILVDPMPNRAGLAPADRAYVQALRELADEIGALLIFDEVICFRLGPNGAQPIWGVEADLTTLGKVIGGGFPIGAVGGRHEVMAVFDPTDGKPPLPQGGTFSANPVSMRCGLAALDLLDAETFARLDRQGDRLRAAIDEAFAAAGLQGHATGMGSLLKIHLAPQPVRDYRSAYLDPEAARRLKALIVRLLNEGVIVAPNGLMALSTPMTDDDIEQIADAIRRSLAQLARQ
ncbi:aspartate aminotransferase family protein [Phenylobacterium sp.]|jgi:glutamate-1-semialdehyde 2,1-aminomutase|uniref:aspartate aminotransferase family protein n=1 Tax=Phenylobacterium sp. TaxID=1871053 RepID=UPI003784B783